MTTIPSPKKDQTKTATKLFSGVSAAALILGVSAITARAAGTTITNTITSFSVTSGQSFDFIDVDGGTITGDLTNNGTVGLTTTAKALQVRFDGLVGGQVINGTNGLVQASATGIQLFKGAFVSQTAPGGFINMGSIVVLDSVSGTSVNARAKGVSVAEGFLTGGPGVTGSQTILNSGTVDVGALVNGANAFAGALGIEQLAFFSTLTTTAVYTHNLTNENLISVSAQANGSGARADATGVQQFVFISLGAVNLGGSNSTTTNEGTIDISVALNGAGGEMNAQGIWQVINEDFTADILGDATQVANNSGEINITVDGSGSGVTATNVDGIDQDIFVRSGSTLGNSNQIVNNDGDINIDVEITGVSATGRADGIEISHFVLENSSAGNILMTVNNSGNILIDFSVSGNNAFGSATAVQQQNFATSNSTVGNVTLTANNSGNVDINFQGAATGTGTQNIAARAFGFRQTAVATTGGAINFNVTNATPGSLNVGATATAVGTSSAIGAQARARATGVFQNINPINQLAANYNFSNSGSLNVGASANASGGITMNSATASAVGFRAGPVSLITGGGGTFLNGSPNQIRNLNVSNNGSVNINATANATSAVANATGFIFQGAVLTGSVSNGGTVSVTASAPSGAAQAVGFAFNGDVNNTTFTNTGNINVLAIGSTTATGVRYAGSGVFTNTIVPGSTDAATFTNNGGTISAWVNNGGTLSHGNAINTVDAPNPVMINLEGGGAITGNILISDDDNILVRNGNTFFDGQVNGASTLVGNLSVASGGTLSMMVGVVSSEANVYVDTYTQTSTGTLSFNITPATTKLGMIHANVANLNGTVNVNIAPGLYTNTTFSDVVAASTLNGTWSSVTTNTNSAFLSLAALYPGDGTADLVLTRNTFNSLGGLTINQLAASTGIDNSYNVNLTGPYGTLVQDLLFMNAATYTAAIEQLHGSEHAQNMKSLLYSFSSLNSAISDRVNIGPYGTRGGGNDIIQRGDISFWARASIGTGDNEGDVEAPGFDQDINAYHAGIDFAAGPNAIFGFAAGYYQNDLDFTNGNTSRNDGVQLAVYGHYDIKDYYLRGVLGYGMYDAESRRSISVANTVGTATGLYDVKVFSARGEFGRRIEINPNVFVTPYGAFDYASVKMDAFTETGAAGANLAFAENKVNAFAADLGARFSTAVNVGNGGLFIPEFSVAWQHDFSDNRVDLSTSFAGGANSSFTVVGSHVSSDSILVNAGLTFATAGGFEIKGEYNGRFNSEYKENSVAIRITYLFGQ